MRHPRKVHFDAAPQRVRLSVRAWPVRTRLSHAGSGVSSSSMNRMYSPRASCNARLRALDSPSFSSRTIRTSAPRWSPRQPWRAVRASRHVLALSTTRISQARAGRHQTGEARQRALQPVHVIVGAQRDGDVAVASCGVSGGVHAVQPPRRATRGSCRSAGVSQRYRHCCRAYFALERRSAVGSKHVEAARAGSGSISRRLKPGCIENAAR